MCQVVCCALACKHKDKNRIFYKVKILAKQLSTFVVHCSVWHVRSVLVLPTNIDALFIQTCLWMNLIQKIIPVMINTGVKSKHFQSIAKKKISKIVFDKNQKTYRKTSNVVNIVGSMIINLSIALHWNKFQFDSKMNQA